MYKTKLHLTNNNVKLCFMLNIHIIRCFIMYISKNCSTACIYAHSSLYTYINTK